LSEPDPKWKEKPDITYEQYFKSPWSMPSEAAVQVARLMERTVGAEKTKALLRQLFVDNAIEMMRRDNNRLIETFDDFSKLLESMLQSQVNQHAMEYILEYEGPNRVRSRMSSCLWAKSFKEMGAEDLGVVMRCGWEPAYFEGFSPHLRVTVNKLLMRGDDCCDLFFNWGET
jgi:hypothetical protein